MDRLKTKTFEIATYKKGDKNAAKVALVLPGKLDTKDYAHLRSHVNYLVGKGYLALSFDPPGTWESPGDINLYTMTNYIKAANELIEYFGNRPTFIMGHSRGSSIATLVAMENPHVTSFVSIFCPLAPGAFTGRTDERWKQQGYNTEYRDLPPGGGPETKRFDLPYSFFEDQQKYDLADGLRICNKPKLFILGNRDESAKPGGVRELYELSAKPKELHELNSDHDYRLHQSLIDEVNQTVGAFLDKYDS